MESPQSYSPYYTHSDTESADEARSRMVAEEVRKLLSNYNMKPSTYLNNDSQPTIFHGKQYNPRRQKGDGRDQWHEDIYESMRRAKIPAVELTTPPPTYSHLNLRYPTFDQDQLELAYQTELHHFQQMNMRMWDIVRGSLSLDGAFESEDKAHIRTHFMNGDLRDAHGLFMWADEKGNRKGIKAQVQVSKELNQWPMLGPEPTQEAFVAHASGKTELSQTEIMQLYMMQAST